MPRQRDQQRHRRHERDAERDGDKTGAARRGRIAAADLVSDPHGRGHPDTERIDAACATGKMPLQTRPHHSPTKSRSVADGNVRILDTQNILLNQIHDLAVKRRLQSVTDMTRQFLFQIDRFLPDRRVKRECLFDCIRRCLCPADYFH